MTTTHYVRPGPEHLHGWLDPALPPILQIGSGDTIVYEDVPDAAWNRWPPGTPADQPVVTPPAGAEHALVGPVYVEGAEPGDVLAISVREMVPRAWGFGYHKPGPVVPNGILGGEPDDIAAEFVRHVELDPAAGVWRYSARVAIPNRPFMGILAVAPAGSGRTRTIFPGPYGGNADCKEFIEGSTVFLPVFHPGALFSTGDAHGAQGDGEIDGAAIETGMDRLVLSFEVRRDLAIERPRAVTPTDFVFLGFGENLLDAVREAARDVMQFLVERADLGWDEAYNVTSIAADFRVTQVADGLLGAHAVLARSVLDA
jgi:acetamidase/formamidase